VTVEVATESGAAKSQTVRRGHGVLWAVFCLWGVFSGAGCGYGDACVEGSKSSCEGNTLVSCVKVEESGGHHTVVHEQRCDTKFCREGDHGAFCALEAEPTARCTPGNPEIQRVAYCEGRIQVQCDSGYVIARADCALDRGLPEDPGLKCVPAGLMTTEFALCISD